MAMDYAKYVRDNPDLAAAATAAGMSASDFGEQHWEGGGKNESRANTPEMSAEEKKDNIEYVRNNPDLRENAEAHGFTADETAQFATWHYDTYGKNEGRLNTPGVVNLPSAADQVLGPEHFQDRPVRSVLEASVRAGDTSEMWKAREAIGAAAGTPWGLDQFTAEGWNLSPDNPYGKAIRAGTIDVVEDVGQLIDTGDPKFLQDRYEDNYRKKDFPDEWVDDAGDWQGPEDLGEYWKAISTAVRDPKTGDISSLVDSSKWATGYDFGDTTGVTSGVASGVGPGVAGLISTVPYTQPAPPDFSDVMPEVSYTDQFEALTSGQGKFFAPWATGQATPSGLLNYQIPGGPPANVTYTGANPSLFDTDTSGSAFSSGNTTTDTSGNKWVMTPGGQWVKAGSDYGTALTGGGRVFGPNFYDVTGAYVGSQGTDETDARFRIGLPGEVRDAGGEKTGEKVGFSVTPLG